MQQLDQVIHVASQPKECPNPKCCDFVESGWSVFECYKVMMTFED
ncbi:hypothetical protein [Calothrix rhizosoleniae]|nr:hypothetical protein [Calothrix rhizosoleniae]